MREALRWALLLSALGHVAVQAHRAWQVGRWRGRYAGALWVVHPAGSPSLTGIWLAVVWPLAPWPLWPLFALGTYWASSWLAIVALGAAWALTRGVAW